jgi:hypothetical protein
MEGNSKLGSVALTTLLFALSFASFIKTLFVDFIDSLVVGFISLDMFVKFQRRTANPLVDLKVMSHRIIVFGNIALLTFRIFQYQIFLAEGTK